MAKPSQKKELPSPPAAVLPWPTRAGVAILALTQLLTPLLFFTNLTRNPYYTQIALLNLFILLAILVWAGHALARREWRLPLLPYHAPLLFFLLFALASTVLSWGVHPSLRSGIFYEGLRVWVFTVVNCCMALYLPLFFLKPLNDSEPRPSIWVDIFLSLIWCAMWFGFQNMKDPEGSGMWDTYGAFIWGLGILYALLRTRRGETLEFFHLIFIVAFVASLYALMQYFNRDIIWSSLIQPYGGRPVSTFGNPNFLSTHLMMVSPLALAFYFRTGDNRRWGYLAISAACALGVLCTLTRSSYLGLVAAFVVMGALLYRRGELGALKNLSIGVAVVVALVVLFPRTPVTGSQSPLARFVEIYKAYKTGESYGSWHQRILIWSSAWEMVKERPFLGKGWGAFELFFPFYQGKFLMSDLGRWRTHANNAHNVLMEMWSQTGILGTGAAIWLMATVIIAGWMSVKRKPDGLSRTVTAAMVGAVAGMIVDNFFGNVSIFFAVPAFLFWWIIGAAALEDGALPWTQRRVSGAVGLPLLCALMAVSVGCGIYFIKRWNEEVFYFQGFKEAKAGQMQESIRWLEKAYASFPGDVNNNYELGNSYGRYGKELADKGLKEEATRMNERAERSYLAAIHANPGYDEIYFNLGVSNVQLGRREKAIEYLRTSVFINPLLKDAYSSLGNQYIQNKQLKEAAALFEQAVAVFSDDKDMWNNLGYTYSQMAQNEKSFQAYKQALILDPNFSQAYHNFAIAAQALGRKDPLLDLPSIVADLENAQKQGNFPEAKRAAQRLVGLLPQSSEAHVSLANADFYANDIDGSIAQYRRVIELKPDLAGAHLNLGRLYQTQKNFKMARDEFTRALTLEPGNADAKQALGQLPAN